MKRGEKLVENKVIGRNLIFELALFWPVLFLYFDAWVFVGIGSETGLNTEFVIRLIWTLILVTSVRSSLVGRHTCACTVHHRKYSPK